MSEANRTALGFVREDSSGILPSNPVVQFFGYVGSPGLGAALTSIASQEIRSDRQITDLILTGTEISGSVNVELATKVHDDFLEGAFFNRFSRKGFFVSTDITSVTGAILTFGDDHGIQEGDLILVEGEEASNNGVKVASNVSGNDVTLSGFSASSLQTGATFRVVGFEADAISIDKANKQITVSGIGRTFKLGEWVCLNVTNKEDKGFYRVTGQSESGGDYTLDYDQFFKAEDNDGSTILSALPANKERLLYGDYVINGTDKQSFALIQRFESHDPVTTFRYRGIHLNTMEISFDTTAIVQANFGVLGLNIVDDSLVTYTTKQALPSVKFSPATDVTAFLLKGSPVQKPNIIQSASLSLNNNLRAQTGIGFVGAAEIVAGTCEITGNVSVFFGSKDIYEDALKNRDSSVMLSFRDAKDNRLLLFDLPRIKYSEGAPDVTGINTDVVASLGFQAILHEEFQHQILSQTFFAL